MAEAFVPSAVATVNEEPAVKADIYSDFEDPIKVAAAALVGTSRTTLFALIAGCVTIVDGAAAVVKVPVIRGKIADSVAISANMFALLVDSWLMIPFKLVTTSPRPELPWPLANGLLLSAMLAIFRLGRRR